MPPWLASNEFWPAARIRTPNEVNRKTSTSATVRMTANALISSDATLNVAPKILVEPFESPGIVIVYCVSGKTVAMTATKCGRPIVERKTKRNSIAPSAPTMPKLINARRAKGRPEWLCSRPTISAANSMKPPCAKLNVSVARKMMTMPSVTSEYTAPSERPPMIAAVNSDICGRHLLLAHGHLARHGRPELLRGEDFAGPALQHNPAGGQAEHSVGDGPVKVNVMLDDHHRDLKLLVDHQEHVLDTCAFGSTESRGRLVKQQNAWPGDRGANNVDHLARAVGEPACLNVGQVGETEQVKQLFRIRTSLAFGLANLESMDDLIRQRIPDCRVRAA